MPTISLADPGGKYLSFREREDIALLHPRGCSIRQIARSLGCSPSTMSRELRRNIPTRGAQLEFRASVAQWKAELMARRPKQAKLAVCSRLRAYVQQRLDSQVRASNGTVVPGPRVAVPKRRSRLRRADRRWSTAWSPQEISRRLEADYPHDFWMRISHEAIYQALYMPGRVGRTMPIASAPRSGRALRVPRARPRNRPQGHVSATCVLSQGTAEADDRSVAGRWKGDLIIGSGRSAIGTLVERRSRYTVLVHLPRLPGYGQSPVVKRGMALAGYSAEAMNAALITAWGKVPSALRRSLTRDRGKELAGHQALTREIGTPVHFADPRCSWQRGTNENTNGLLRQYFPNGTDLSRCVAHRLGRRRSGAERPATRGPRVEDTNRSLPGQRRITENRRRCDNRLNPPYHRRWRLVSPGRLTPIEYNLSWLQP